MQHVSKTGERAAALASLLEAAGLRRVTCPAVRRIDGISEDRVRALRELYQALGGGPERFPLIRPGGWDLAFGDGLLVELDEQQDFNRYRAMTLKPPWADSLPWARCYQFYCNDREVECMRYGKAQGRWTNPSAERFFGAAQVRGGLDGVGAPRWRQRAFYDAVKDALPGRRLARVSVHDEIEGRSLESILRAPDTAWATKMHALVSDRVSDGDAVEFRFNV
jgi:hypothetical protein